MFTCTSWSLRHDYERWEGRKTAHSSAISIVVSEETIFISAPRCEKHTRWHEQRIIDNWPLVLSLINGGTPTIRNSQFRFGSQLVATLNSSCKKSGDNGSVLCYIMQKKISDVLFLLLRVMLSLEVLVKKWQVRSINRTAEVFSNRFASVEL